MTESPDSVPHVHKVSEAALWWADCYPQWKGKARNEIHNRTGTGTAPEPTATELQDDQP